MHISVFKSSLSSHYVDSPFAFFSDILGIFCSFLVKFVTKNYSSAVKNVNSLSNSNTTEYTCGLRDMDRGGEWWCDLLFHSS